MSWKDLAHGLRYDGTTRLAIGTALVIIVLAVAMLATALAPLFR